MVVLLVIVLWDVPWYFFALKGWRSNIEGWMWRNVRTALLIVLCMVTIGLVWGPECAELVALLYVFLVSMVDFTEMFAGREPPQTFFALF